MSKKMKMIPSIFKNRDSKLQQWQWPLCYHHPKTLSFRAIQDDDAVFKTVNSVFLDTSDGVETPESWFTNSDDCASTANLSTDGGHYSDDATTKNSSLETVIRGVQRSSERLFFEPGGDTSSILIKCSEKTITGDEDAAVDGGGGCLLPLPYKESVAVAMESEDPYLDFKKSMAEMVESHGLEDWDCLEELLRWYLKMNGKINHGFIVGAFVDLLVGMAAADAAAAGSSSSTAAAAVCCSSEETAYSSADSCFSSHSSPLSLSPAAGVGRHGQTQTGIDDQGGDVIIVQSNYL